MTDPATDFGALDYFFGPELIADPYPYFDHLRSKCPVLPGTPAGVVTVSGHDEAMLVYKDPAMSSVNSVIGPLAPLPFEVEGDDITDLIAEHRVGFPMAEYVGAMDAPQHTQIRGLMNQLITPKRLKENEQFIWRLTDEQLSGFVPSGHCEFMTSYAKPLSLLVIADLLGVPEEDHEEFSNGLSGQLVDGETLVNNPLEWLYGKFNTYISARREAPQADVLTGMAQATYEDGTVPDIDDVVKLAVFVFAAGQETTAKLLSQAVLNLAEHPEIQEKLRADRSLIGVFLEETLRLESPVKTHFRLAATTTSIDGCPVNAGTTVMLLPGAANRDPRKFTDPNEFRLDRPNVREHIAFGRGSHICPGAPLARAEAKISLNRILDTMGDIRLSEKHHGTAEARKLNWEPTFIMRGLTDLHLEFTPID